MAEEVLGISGSMDISDIQKSMDDLIGQLNKLNIETDKLSRDFTAAMQKIQASSNDNATKQKQAMQLFADSIAQAKDQIKDLPDKIKKSGEEANVFSKACDTIRTKMLDMKIGSAEFAKLNTQLEQNQLAAKRAAQFHDELATSFKNTADFIANASASIDAFNGISSIATGATAVNAASHGAMTAILAGETAGRAANTEAISKETDAMSENNQASQTIIENIGKQNAAVNEYSASLDALSEKLRNNQAVSQEQISKEIALAEQRIKQLTEEKNKKEELANQKYTEYEDYSNKALLGNVADKDLNTQRAKEAVDVYNNLRKEIDLTDNSVREIQTSINTLNGLLKSNAETNRTAASDTNNTADSIKKEATTIEEAKKNLVELESQLKKYREEYNSLLGISDNSSRFTRWYREMAFSYQGSKGMLPDDFVQKVIQAKDGVDEYTQKVEECRKKVAELWATQQVKDDPYALEKASVEELKKRYIELKREKREQEKALESTSKNKQNLASDNLRRTEKELDAITKKLKEVGVEVDKLENKASSNGNIFSRLFGQVKGGFGGGISGIFSTITSGKFLGWAAAIGAVAKGLWDASKAAEEYRKALAPLKHYMDDISFKEVRQDILALTSTTTKSAGDMAGAATYFVKVWEGLRNSPDALITMVKAANEFAALSGKTSSEAAKTMANLASEYHLTGQQTTEVSSIIATATRNSTSDFEEMTQAIMSSGSQAAIYGVSFRDMATLIGYSSNQFGGASKAASKLSMILMKMNGLEEKFRPASVGMIQALQNMKEAYDRGERPQDKFMLRQRAIAEYFIKNADAIKKYGDAIDNNKTKQDILADKAKTAEANIGKMKNAWNGLLTSLNVNITPIITKIVQGLNTLIGGVQRTTKELRALERYGNSGISKNTKKVKTSSGKEIEFEYDVTKDVYIDEYNKQESKLALSFRNQANYLASKKGWERASNKAITETAARYLRNIVKSKKDSYYTIDDKELETLITEYTNSWTALRTKTINSGDFGNGGNDESKDASKRAKNKEELIKIQRQKEYEAEKQALATLQAQREAYTASISNDSEREIQAMRDAHSKRMEEIEQQEKEMLRSNISKAEQEYRTKHQNDKKYTGFYSQGLDKNVGLTVSQKSQIDALRKFEEESYRRTIKAKQEADDNYRLQYLEKYGYDYEKRLAIAQQYEKKIANASNEWQRKSLEEEKKSALSAFDLKQVTQMMDWETILGDIQKYSRKALKVVKEQISAFMKTDEYKALQPSEKKIIIDIQRQIDDNLESNPFKRYSKAIAELKEAQQDFQSAKIGQEAAAKNPEASPQMKEFFNNRYTEALKRLNKAQSEADKSGSNLVDKLNLMIGAFGKLSAENISIGELGSTAADTLSTLGYISKKTGSLIGMIAGAIDLLAEIELDDLIVGILENVVQAVGSVFQGIGNIFGIDLGLGKADYSGWQEADTKYRQLSEVWDSLIDKKKEYLNMSWGVEAQNVGEEILNLIEMDKQQAKLAAQARLDSGASKGSHSIWYRMWQGSYTSKASDNKGALDMSAIGRSDINWSNVNDSVERGLKEAGLGEAKFQSMSDMLNMTSDQLLWIKENYAGLWSVMDTEFRGYLEQIIEYGDKAEDVIEALKEQVLSTSLDNVFDSALSSLQKYADGSEDVFDEISENYQKMINKMLVNSTIGNRLRSELESWYEQWYAAYDNDKTINSSEIAALKQQYDEIINNAKNEIDALRQAGLIKDTDYETQSATAKSISSITYDQANALEGRITAIQICCEQHLSEIQSQSEMQQEISTSVNSMLTSVLNIDANISQILSIQTSMNEHLENISSNTSCLPEMARDITKIKKNTENL